MGIIPLRGSLFYEYETQVFTSRHTVDIIRTRTGKDRGSMGGRKIQVFFHSMVMNQIKEPN